MKTFATLINALDSTNKTNQKVAAIENFLSEASNDDKLWLLALFTGKKPKRTINTNLLKAWAMEVAQIPEWLFVECYSSVGDLGETIALLLPDQRTDTHDKTLSEWMQNIIQLKDLDDAQKKAFVVNAWHKLNSIERFIFNKLIGGSFRIGVSNKMLINALAKYYQLEPAAVAHSIMGDWQFCTITFDELVHGTYTNTQLSQPYPFCLAYPIEQSIKSIGEVTDWQVEYKWDGIRGQIIRRAGEIYIWSRGEELVTDQFPELVAAFSTWESDFVIDGEILAYKDQTIQPFATLQQRLNRKSITKKMLEEIPIAFYSYDLLEMNGEDMRNQPLVDRRNALEALFNQATKHDNILLSPTIKASTWEEYIAIRAESRTMNSEGLMLKHLQSTYHAGRKRGDWWKWKVDPMTIDAVLIYAQKGSGRRSGHYTDYTFAVKDGEKLVTIAKAYSGLTDKEIQEVSKFVNKNAVEQFGPVRTVKPELVFEIAFEGISYSKRHKSGVALRFPRILRWRKDKKADEIDDIENIKKMIP